MKEIFIQPVLNGFIVKIGCSTVVFTSIDRLCSELKRYQTDPSAIEAEYQNQAINQGSDTTSDPRQQEIRVSGAEIGVGTAGRNVREPGRPPR